MFANIRSFYPIQELIRIARDHRIPLYIVGGVIRDCLRGSEMYHDCDFVVDGDVMACVAPFAKTVKGTVIPWDRDQIRVIFTFSEEKICFDFSRMRGSSLTEDLALRDFTVNACAVSLEELATNDQPQIIDPCGGSEDLRAARIVCCGPSCFMDDPVRILRAVRLARECRFSLDEEVLKAMAAHAEYIMQPSIERIKRELFSIFACDDVVVSLKELYDTGVLGQLIPEINTCIGIQQSFPHRYDLFHHIMETVRSIDLMSHNEFREFGLFADILKVSCNTFIEEGVTRKALLVFAALLHDIGKPATARTIDDRITFYGHEKIGEKLCRKIAQRIGLGRTAQRIVGKLIGSHMRLLQLCLLDTITERAMVRLIRDCEDVFWELIILAYADALATGAQDSAYKEQVENIRLLALKLAQKRTEESYQRTAKPLLTGKDIINILGIPEGPMVGAILAELHEREQQGICSTREEALEWLKKRQQ
ncbi:MAG: HD domain-containing protein [Desulfobacterota bacterium]|nr:HD domain-containing protein [Thermodesulfobacteriota bacterium]